MSESYDYIIIGAGSAGCVLANRLGADRSLTVLVLEAGPMDWDLMVHVPAGVHRVWRDPRLNWNYQTEPEAALQDRNVFMPRGKVIGGSSSINSMVYMRGHPLDYDGWAGEPGLADWSNAHCLPYFKAGETYAGGADTWRGGAGSLGVCRGDFANPLYDAFIEAGEQAGQGVSDDLNGYNPEGVARLDATKRHGRRCSAAVAHLRPALRRGNVTLKTRAAVRRIVLEGNRAAGVVFDHKGARLTAHAGREVILSGGAINSPHLLMLSGIGPADHLRAHGIEVHADLPGVGRNLQDHASIILQYESLESYPIHKVDRPWRKAAAGAWWVFTRGGIAASNIWEAGGLIRGNDRVPYPNLQYHFGPVGFEYDNGRIALKQAFAVHVDQLRPKSRGEIRLASADPADRPVLRFDYLSDIHDLHELVEGVHKTRDLVAQTAFDGLRGVEMDPGPETRTDTEIANWVRAATTTDFHPCGTCRMGAGAAAVVDGEMRVHGVEALRVVDASVMPHIISANLNAPTQMIASRAADYILGNPMLPPEHVRYRFHETGAGRSGLEGSTSTGIGVSPTIRPTSPDRKLRPCVYSRETVPEEELEQVVSRLRARPELYAPDVMKQAYRPHVDQLLPDPFSGEVIALVNEALRAETPFSAIRLGDGEVNILAFGAYEGTPNLNRHAVWAGLQHRADTFALSDVWMHALRDLLMGAVQAADVIGVVGLYRRIGRGPLEVDDLVANLRKDWRGQTGHWRGMEFLLELAESGLFSNKVVASAHFYFSICAGVIDLVSRARSTLLLTNREGVVEKLRARLPGSDIGHIPVGQARALGEENLHEPKFLDRVDAALPNDLKGCLCLVGAGPWAEIYCTWIKRRGGVAVDIGSGFDLLDGRITRPVHRSHGYQAQNPFAL